MRPDGDGRSGPAPRCERSDHRQVRPDAARRGPRPVAELLAEAADRAVGGDRVGTVDDQAAGFAHVERQQVVHRGRRRHGAIGARPDGEERAGHGGEQPGPALDLADAPLIAPVEPFLGRGGGRGLVAPLEPSGDAADARIAQRRRERRQAARREARLGVGQDDRVSAGRLEQRGLGRGLAASRQGQQADAWIARCEVGDDRLGGVGRAVRSDQDLERRSPRSRPGRGRRRSARRCARPRRGPRSRRSGSVRHRSAGGRRDGDGPARPPRPGSRRRPRRACRRRSRTRSRRAPAERTRSAVPRQRRPPVTPALDQAGGLGRAAVVCGEGRASSAPVGERPSGRSPAAAARPRRWRPARGGRSVRRAPPR